MSSSVRNNTDPISQVVKSFNKAVKRHVKRQENRQWQNEARQYRGLYV